MQFMQFRSEAEGFAIRAVDLDSAEWFVLADICAALEIENRSNAVARLDEDEVRQADIIDALGRAQKTTIISESGLYALILRSDKPKAKPFRRWVTHEVLPAIRRTGSYDLLARESAPPAPLEHPLTQFLRAVDALGERGVAPVKALYALGNLFQSSISAALQTRLALLPPVFVPAPVAGYRTRSEPEKKPKTPLDGRVSVAQWSAAQALELTKTERVALGKRVPGVAKERGIEPLRKFSDSGPLNYWPAAVIAEAWAQMNAAEAGGGK